MEQFHFNVEIRLLVSISGIKKLKWGSSFLFPCCEFKDPRNNFRNIRLHSRDLWWFINVTKSSRCIYNPARKSRLWLVLHDQLPAPSYTLSRKRILTRTKGRMEKKRVFEFSLQTSHSFPGSHVAALTVVPKLALHKGERSITASDGN